MAVDVVVRGKWKTVELEPSLFLQKDFDHLICIEELTDYTVLGRKTTEVVCISYVLYYRSYLGCPVKIGGTDNYPYGHFPVWTLHLEQQQK